MSESGFIDGLVKVMLGWARWLTDLMWGSINSTPSEGGFLAWFGANWPIIFLIMLAAGILIDWLVWLIRWRPYWLWFRKKQIIYAEEGEIPLAEQEAERRRMEEGLVGIPAGGDDRLPAQLSGPEQHQVKHPPDALGRAFRGINCSAAEEPAYIGFTAGNDPFRLIQAVRPGNFRNVHALHAQEVFSLMAGHMEPQGIFPAIFPDKITNRRFHITFDSRCDGWPP